MSENKEKTKYSINIAQYGGITVEAPQKTNVSIYFVKHHEIEEYHL